MRLQVREAMLCLEGEGQGLGTPTFLIRLAGCDLRCWWCDSKHASFTLKGSRNCTVRDLLRQAKASGASWVSVTGGEPLARSSNERAALGQLLKALKAGRFKIKIETNGLNRWQELDSYVDLWSVAPKWDARSKSLAQPLLMRHDVSVLKDYCLGPGRQGRLQLKFVIPFTTAQKPVAADLKQAMSLLKLLGSGLAGVPVFVTPEGSSPQDLLSACRVLSLYFLKHCRAWNAYDLRVTPQWHRILNLK
jgi:organic radical activating enzyme